MSLTLPQIKKFAEEIKPFLIGKKCGSFFAIAPRKFILSVVGEPKVYYLLMCFQEPFLRFHLFTRKFRKEEHLQAQKIDSILAGSNLEECSLLNEDRILSLSFYHGSKVFRLIAEFFPRKPNLYLINHQNEILASLNPKTETTYQLPEKPHRTHKEETASLSQSYIEIQYEELEKEAEFLFQKNQVSAYLKKNLKQSQKQLGQREEKLHRCQAWGDMQHEALLLQANLYQIKKGLSKVVVDDWNQAGMKKTITLNPQEDPAKEVARRFQQSKKLKTGLTHMQGQVMALQKEIEQYQKHLQILENLTTKDELEIFCRSLKNFQPKAVKPLPSKPYREFVTARGLKIWVGKSAAQNEKLTFQLANGSDNWFHVVGYAGSHVVLHRSKGQDPDPDSIQDAAELALRYSQAKGEADIYLTQCKYVMRSSKKGSGKVQISQHKVIHATLDEERWQKIRERKGRTGSQESE